jgi:GT2 family glycosyltransferase/glycosyltransferase involved in cell wall biosynthesis
VLIISTTFFPDPGVSAIRMTQWCRHLPEHGWKPFVLCRYYGFAASPEELKAQVHPEVSVEYLDRPTANPSQSPPRHRWTRVVRDELLSAFGINRLFVPDPSILFWHRQRAAILGRVREIEPDVILTTSPPHSNHDIGLWLAGETGIPWVADFRDPYLMDDRFRPQGLGLLRWEAHRRFRNSIYERAWLVTHAIPNQARWMRRQLPWTQDRLLTLTNGFPPEMLKVTMERQGPRERKTILVSGTIPDPEKLALARSVARLAAEGVDARLVILGRRPDCEPELRTILGERVELPGYVPHAESVRQVMRADVLVNFLDEFRAGTRLLSTKLFEYLASGKPVVCVNPSRADRLLLWRQSGVAVLRRPSPAQLDAALRDALSGSLRRDPAELERFRAEYNWPRRAAQLAAALDRLVAFPPLDLPAARPAKPRASVVITTRNRRDLLRQCIRSALAQSVPVEVLVLDDGSTDGTPAMVRSEFPSVRLCELGAGKGPSFQRNRGIEMASTNIVFPIDDDAVFSTARVVEQTLGEFDHCRVAAVGIPFKNVRQSQEVRQRAPDSGGPWALHAFVGAAHAVRRDAFLQAGGYREHLFYMGEEGDLCLRLLALGFVTRAGRSDPIHHYESPYRNSRQAAFCGRRNDILFACQNVPRPYFSLHLAGTTLNGLQAALTSGQCWAMLRGLAAGYRACATGSIERRPVPAPIYRLHRRLKKGGAILLSDLEKQLP